MAKPKMEVKEEEGTEKKEPPAVVAPEEGGITVEAATFTSNAGVLLTITKESHSAQIDVVLLDSMREKGKIGKEK